MSNLRDDNDNSSDSDSSSSVFTNSEEQLLSNVHGRKGVTIAAKDKHLDNEGENQLVLICFPRNGRSHIPTSLWPLSASCTTCRGRHFDSVHKSCVKRELWYERCQYLDSKWALQCESKMDTQWLHQHTEYAECKVSSEINLMWIRFFYRSLDFRSTQAQRKCTQYMETGNIRMNFVSILILQITFLNTTRRC